MRIAGAVVALCGLGLAFRSALLLAGRGRPKRGPTPALVIAGPYVRLRNPLYAGALLMLSGMALATRSPVLAAVTVLAAVALHGWVVAREEPALRRRFGTAYDAYLAHVPRWLPGRETPGAGDD